MIKRYYIMLVGAHDSLSSTSLEKVKEVFLAAKSNKEAVERAKTRANRLSMRVEVVCQHAFMY